MVKFDFSLEPTKAIEYLKSKGYKLSFDYDEIIQEAHHKAFTVAKVTKLDLLSDIHEELLKSLKDGTPFKQFQKNLKPKLIKKGWWGEKEIVNPKTGEVKKVYIGSRRLKTIYETNLRSAYNQAREEQMDELPLSVYRRYVSALLENTRKSHAKMHGIVKHKDDPWWKINSPLNGWNCKCKKQAVSKTLCEKKGWDISSKPIQNIADKDFAYDTRSHRAALANNYYNKVQAISCKDMFTNAKQREVLCPYKNVILKNYKEDMLKLRPTQQEWDKFVDDSLDKSIKRHKETFLGFLSMIVGLEDYLKANPPKSDVILAHTGTIRNLKAKGEDVAKGQKAKKTISTKDIKELYTKIHHPDEIYIDGDILLIYNIQKGKNKIVLKIDHNNKKYTYNDIYSGQVYDDLFGFERNFIKKAKKIK